MKHAIPTASRVLADTARKLDYVDSFSAELLLREQLTVDYLMARVFSSMPRWIFGLFVVRNLLVSPFGLETGALSAPLRVTRDVHFEPGSKDCFFTVIDRSDDEIVMAESDKHLDFRVSVKKSEVQGRATLLELTTVVWYNNWLGPVYFTFVKPFHRALMRSMMRRAASSLLDDYGAGSKTTGAPANRSQ